MFQTILAKSILTKKKGTKEQGRRESMLTYHFLRYHSVQFSQEDRHPVPVMTRRILRENGNTLKK